jgi:hypothetical protein
MSRTSELTHLFRAMKAPAAARALPTLAERARPRSRKGARATSDGESSPAPRVLTSG